MDPSIYNSMPTGKESQSDIRFDSLNRPGDKLQGFYIQEGASGQNQAKKLQHPKGN
jgi:hypothetical protein